MLEKEITKRAFFWTWASNTPFWALYSMLPFLLYKEMGASFWTLTLAISLKPVVALISPFFTSCFQKYSLKNTVSIATLLSHLPFLFFPFIDHPLFIALSFGLYMFIAKGAMPVWIEILRRFVEKKQREQLFSIASSFEYLGGGLLPFAIGYVLDTHIWIWKWLFASGALFSMTALLFQKSLPKAYFDPPKKTTSWCEPWENAWSLVKTRPNVRDFQIGFMLGGTGLILLQPALPIFFLDRLDLSYMELALALTLFKGIGFALSAPFWTRYFNAVDIFGFCKTVTLVAAIFPLLLITALFRIELVFVAYLAYGIMQSGSELSWHMSGPYFSLQEDSMRYTNLNVIAVGVRGLIVPTLGTMLCITAGPLFVLLTGSAFCLLAAIKMQGNQKKWYGITPVLNT